MGIESQRTAAWIADDTGSERLTERSVIAYLIDRGLLNPQSIVHGDVKVVTESRRNLNFRVTTTLAKNYFVKQGLGDDRSLTVGREGAFLEFARDAQQTSRLRRYLPRVADWNAEQKILVLHLAQEARNLADHHHRSGRWSAGLAREVGTALTRLHRRKPFPCETFPAAALDRRPPWVLSIHRPDLRIFDDLSGSGIALVKLVQGAPQLCSALDLLRLSWQPSALIHGDLTWGNVIVHGDGRHHVQLVDWEFVQLGDPLWDAGSFLSQYLNAWIVSIPMVGSPPHAQTDAARVPIQQLQPAMKRFWESYAHGAHLEGLDRAVARDRVVRYAAARLVQTALEADQHLALSSTTGVLRLQVAQNMLQHPTQAATTLMGLSE
jgi:Ser/Thr protein kinase RdoA (MazF antagonist)